MKGMKQVLMAALGTAFLVGGAQAATFPPNKVNPDPVSETLGEISAYPKQSKVALKPVVKPERKHMTQLWLNMQTRGQMATSQTDTLTPEAAKAAQERMQQSFSHPIPDKFIKDKFGGS
ncbi:DUF3613 domain-containing protein [Photobacterium sp. 1_MG-2023]|uniref:DUF3613 domain-containing protein n=1 Tax=Photobacterium sp. 1_MG-2023 TaxID=3062646 RepID=UPI0026E47C5D|nr:DUF3613 domain-containing protein [Photobacterium sp. 1_MG-2023]MDO6708774.1 DUF3613 domain-containing protein [Photobacterium sp. 1_MG-2023]